MPSDSSKLRRPKRKLEPITFEELYATSNMSGFVSFLQMKPGETVSLPHLAPAAPAGTGESSGGPTAPAGGGTADSQTSAPESSAPDSGALITGAPESAEPPQPSLFPLPPLPRPPRIREALTAQDGHSLGEQAVYDVLYRTAQPYPSDEVKILTIGYRTLAERARMAYSNCKINVRSLVEKLALELVGDFTYTGGTTFLVYGYREVLRRRRAAGLTHVIRRRSVIFVEPATGIELTGRNKGKTSALITGAPEPTGPSYSSAPVTIKASALESGALILDNNYEKRTSSSDDRRTVAQALLQFVALADDDAAENLLLACREKAPDATAAEVAHFVALKGRLILRRPEVRNPLGLLQVAVPKCFEGESFRLYREAERRQEPDNGPVEASARAEWQALLEDPDSDEELRQMAKRALGLA